MKKKINVGIIGYGLRGCLAKYIKNNNGFNIIGFCDTNPKATEKFKKEIKKDIFTTDNIEKLLQMEKIEAIVILSPDHLHFKHTMKAIKAKKHIFLEKPMGISIKECDKILKEAMQNQIKLFIGHNMRYFEFTKKMKELIDKGIIGKIESIWCRHYISYGGDAYFKDWHSQIKNSFGLLLQKGAHDIDIIHWLAGGYTKKVIGMGKLSVYNQVSLKNRRKNSEPYKKIEFKKNNWPGMNNKGISEIINVEDHSMIMMQLDNGVQASYMQSMYTPDTTRNYSVIGTKGRIENIRQMNGDVHINIHTKRIDAYGKPDKIIIIKNNLSISHDGADPKIIQGFLEWIRDNKIPNTSPLAARESVATGYMGTISLRSGSKPKKVKRLSQKILDYYSQKE